MSARARNLFVVVLGLVLAGTPFAADPTPEAIAQAVRQLGDDSFAVREKASAFLWAAGKAAEPALREAVKSSDLEVSRRAADILGKFKWGIYPDTPREVVDLIKEYQTGDFKLKRAVIDKLLQKGNPGYAVVLKIAAVEENAGFRQNLFELLDKEVGRLVPQLVSEGKPAVLEELLELNLAGGMEAAYQNYVAFLLLSGRLDDKMAQLKSRGDKPGGAQTAAMLAYLYRAKGDLANARLAAEKAARPQLVVYLLQELGAWKELLDKHRPRLGDMTVEEIEVLGLLAAYQRLGGDVQGFEQTVGAIKKYAQGKPPDSGEVWYGAEALLLNDRPEDGIQVLIAGKNYGAAFDLLIAQLRYREAFELADKARAENSTYLIGMETHRARVLYQLGDKEKALTLLAKIGGEIKEPKDIAGPHPLVEVEYKLGLKEEAFDHAAAFLNRLQGIDPGWLLGQVFPEKGTVAAVWWQCLRKKYAAEEPTAVMKRLRDLLDGKTTGKELETLAAEADRMSLGVKPDDRDQWLQAIAEACQAAGREDLARTYLEKAAGQPGSAAALIRLGDFLAAKTLWKEAADRYGQAWDKDRKEAIPLYLRGWALTRAGQDKEGQRLMELAHWLPLGNEKARHALAETLAKHDLPEAAQREFQLVLRTGPFDSWHTNSARRYCGREALAKKDYLAVAAHDERAMLECLKTNTSFVKTLAYLAVPHLVHRHRALGLLTAGRIEDALKESLLAQAALPGEADLPIALVPELKKRGHRKEAEELFNRVFAVYEELSKDYPQSAFFHNSLAWLSARCRRQLDQALEHARKAVELAPEQAGLVDTLAEVHFQRGAKDQAVMLMKKCIQMDPKREYFRKQLRRFEAGDSTVDVSE